MDNYTFGVLPPLYDLHNVDICNVSRRVLIKYNISNGHLIITTFIIKKSLYIISKIMTI